jgi:hypothetical protein
MVAIFNPVLSVVTLRKIDYNALFMVSYNVCLLSRLRLKDNRKDSVSGAHSTNSPQPLIPHMLVPPKEVCTFSA